MAENVESPPRERIIIPTSYENNLKDLQHKKGKFRGKDGISLGAEDEEEQMCLKDGFRERIQFPGERRGNR